jgi:flavin reductase (DIM6/NTAB) family NADH-FMN oxidoreductase RutF
MTLAESQPLRRAFSTFPSGVVAVAAVVDGVPVGMAASSFTSVSLRPPLVSVCIDRGSRTWPQLRDIAACGRRLGVSVLSEEHERICRQLAAREGDRFHGLNWRHDVDGAVALDGAAASFACSVHREVDAGDHVMVLLQIHCWTGDPAVAPLVFHGSRFRTLAP